MRRWQAFLAALGLALVLAGVAGAWRIPALAAIDLDASRDLQRLRTPDLDVAMGLVSLLGTTPVLAAGAILAALLLRANGHRREAVAALLCLLADPLNFLLKLVANRPRPADPVAVITQTFGSSFPSGHSMGSAAVYGTLAALVWTLRGPRPLLILFLTIPLAVGFSRVYLGAHWGYDVVGGWAAGALCVAGVMVWLRHGIRSV